MDLLLTFLFNHNAGGSSQDTRVNPYLEEKVSLFADDMNLYTENSNSTKNSIRPNK
jgi:hypothetical protein